MGIMDPVPVAAPTLDQKKAVTRAMVKKIVKKMRDHIAEDYAEGFEQIWHNPLGLTPQESLDALLGEAVELLRFAETIKGTTNNLVPGTIKLAAPKDVTANPNGTVTVAT